jgi:hypothetical protein
LPPDAQQFGHVDAVALTARQEADLFLLIRALEVEGPGIDAAVHLHIAQMDHLGPARDFFPDVLVGVQRIARLVDIGQVHRVAQGDRALIGRLAAR